MKEDELEASAKNKRRTERKDGMVNGAQSYEKKAKPQKQKICDQESKKSSNKEAGKEKEMNKSHY